MILRWILRWIWAGLGGAWLGTVLGAWACVLTPGPALGGIAVGVMVTVLGWVLVALGAMSTPKLRRFAFGTGALALLGTLLILWRMVA